MSAWNRYVAAWATLFLLGAPHSGWAQESRRGLYVGIEQGVTLARTLSAPLTGDSQPTRCDALLYAAGVPAGTDCPASAPREIYDTEFDLGAGFVAGVAAGYGWRWVRVEVEYLNQHQGSTSSLIYGAEDSVVSGKTREWNDEAPPFARVSDVRAHHVFANVYLDIANGSRWTPYVGAGLGAARTSLGYGNRYVRKTLPAGLLPDRRRRSDHRRGRARMAAQRRRHGQRRGRGDQQDAPGRPGARRDRLRPDGTCLAGHQGRAGRGSPRSRTSSSGPSCAAMSRCSPTARRRTHSG